MYCLAGTDSPWARRLDHLICEVPDIEVAYERFVSRGFPSAWPIGRFWPGRQTAGIALGGVNLELVQPDESPPVAARIHTLVFEPTSLDEATANLARQGIGCELIEKWEDVPDILRMRGFTESESRTRQLICRNAYPKGDLPIRFFFCEYGPILRARLAPSAFPCIPPISQITIATPNPAGDWFTIDRLLGLPKAKFGVEIKLSEMPGDSAEVVEIRSDRGPIDLGDWPARFRLN